MTKTAGETAASQDDVLRMTTEVVAAYLGNNTMPATQIPDVINTVYGSLSRLDGNAATARPRTPKAPVAIRKSIMPPEEYRAKWGLPSDYPMVAPNYSRQRSAFAKKIGLGRTATRSKRRNAA